MCQKAFGGPFGSLVTVKVADLTWTRGERSTFQSSDVIERGFCAACGTPLTYKYNDEHIDLSTFAFDDTSAVEPAVKLAVESRPVWMEHLAEMPVRQPMGGSSVPVVSRQYPDFDTTPTCPAARVVRSRRRTQAAAIPRSPRHGTPAGSTRA